MNAREDLSDLPQKKKFFHGRVDNANGKTSLNRSTKLNDGQRRMIDPVLEKNDEPNSSQQEQTDKMIRVEIPERSPGNKKSLNVSSITLKKYSSSKK